MTSGLLSVFRHVRQVRLPRQEARRLRTRHRRPPRGEKNRERADGSEQSAKDQGRNIAVRANVKPDGERKRGREAFPTSIRGILVCGLQIGRLVPIIIFILNKLCAILT